MLDARAAVAVVFGVDLLEQRRITANGLELAQYCRILDAGRRFAQREDHSPADHDTGRLDRSGGRRAVRRGEVDRLLMQAVEAIADEHHLEHVALVARIRLRRPPRHADRFLPDLRAPGAVGKQVGRGERQAGLVVDVQTG